MWPQVDKCTDQVGVGDIEGCVHEFEVGNGQGFNLANMVDEVGIKSSLKLSLW